jgi:hypothetical protein
MQILLITSVLIVAIAPSIASACPNYGCRARLHYFENGKRVVISLPGNLAPWSPAVIVR